MYDCGDSRRDIVFAFLYGQFCEIYPCENGKADFQAGSFFGQGIYKMGNGGFFGGDRNGRRREEKDGVFRRFGVRAKLEEKSGDELCLFQKFLEDTHE